MYRARKKNWASMAKDTMNPTRLAPRKVREAKNEKLTIGAGLRRSISTNVTSAARAMANRMMIRVDPQSWTCDYAIRIRNDTPDTVRSHDMTFDDSGFIWLATANSSRSYAEGVQGLSKYDPKTGEVLEQVTLEPGSCDPHGLGFYKGAFIGCDAGHHPGWPDKDGPGVGWIFRIDIV